jgi:hypothetical protein
MRVLDWLPPPFVCNEATQRILDPVRETHVTTTPVRCAAGQEDQAQIEA